MQIVLREIDMISLKRSREGFNDINFTLGVLDCFLISYVIGAYPQHLCKLYMYYLKQIIILDCSFVFNLKHTLSHECFAGLLYFIQSFYMLPRKFYNMWNAKPLNQALYYLDFCVRNVYMFCGVSNSQYAILSYA